MKGDWNFHISDLVKNPDGTDTNPCGEFRWSPEGPVSQIHSPHLHIGALGIFSDLLRSVQMLKREWGAEIIGKLPYLFILGKTAALVPEFAVEDLPSAELQPRFLCLQWRTCPWAEHSDVDDYMYLKIILLLTKNVTIVIFYKMSIFLNIILLFFQFLMVILN